MIPSPLHPHEPPRLILAHLPTPIVELHNLPAKLALPKLFVKRDDLTGLETSGNKIRKLEYVVADAIKSGADTLVTHGGYQSNHCRATAAVAARLGLGCRLVLRSPENPANDGNLFLDRLFGAEITLHSVEEYRERKKELVNAAMNELRAKGHRPYFFPVGASIPLGCWGYIRCFHEMLTQLGREKAVDVYVTAGSSGTVAGLVLGKAIFGAENYRIVGVPISDSVEFFQQDIRTLITQTVNTYTLGLSDEQAPVELIDGYIGEGYAMPTAAGMDALRLMAKHEGLLLDPTYTAKAFAGFLEQVRSGAVRAGAMAVFVHTGGVFGLMARGELF